MPSFSSFSYMYTVSINLTFKLNKLISRHILDGLTTDLGVVFAWVESVARKPKGHFVQLT
jgi:hypothetical protein